MQVTPINCKYRKTMIIPLVMFVSAAILRIYAAVVPGIIVPDGITYINTAKMIRSGNWQGIYDFGVFSLYPFLIAFFQRFISDWEMTARSISIFSGSLAVILFYLIIKRIFDLKIAVIAAVFFIISPRLVEYSSNVLREPVFWFFSLAGLCCALEGIYRRQWWFMVVSAFFVGLSAFTRMEGLATAIIVIMWTVFYCWVEKTLSARKLTLFFLIFIISFSVLFCSPLLFLKNRIGQWEFGHIGSKIPLILMGSSQKAEQTFQKNIEESDIITKSLSGSKYLVFLWEVLYKFFRSFHVVFILLFIIGIIRRKTIPYNTREILLIMWWFVFFLISLIYTSKTYYLSTRHGMLMSIPCLAWVSVGFYETIDILKTNLDRSGYRQQWKNRAFIVTMVVMCAVVLSSTLSWSGTDKLEMKKAGIYLKEKGYSRTKFIVEPRLTRLAFYADAEFKVLDSNVKSSDMGNFLRASGADILIIDTETMGNAAADFIKNNSGEYLEKIDVNEFARYKKYSFVMFKIKR